eukprot:scaffold30724_cov44-Attheya_sp.AAC.5
MDLYYYYPMRKELGTCSAGVARGGKIRTFRDHARTARNQIASTTQQLLWNLLVHASKVCGGLKIKKWR